MSMYKKLIISASATLAVVAICVASLLFLINADKNDDNSTLSTDNVLANDASVDNNDLTSVDVEDSSPNGEISSEVSDEPIVDEKYYLTLPEGTILHSPNVIVYNLSKQYAVYSNITYETTAPASLAKMLTALVALDHLSVSSSIKVGDEIDLIGANSSTAFLQKGSRYKVGTMLEALLLPSGNDAAYSLAVNTARAHADDYTLSTEDAVKDFVRLMNDKAKSIGCISSSFMSPDGYDTEGQYTTTEDMLKISIAAYTNPTIKECVAKAENSQHNWQNSNLLIREDSKYYNPSVDGLKTGSTDGAGKCLAVSAEIGSDVYIMLFMKGETNDGRFIDANTVIDIIKQQNNIFDEDESSEE